MEHFTLAGLNYYQLTRKCGNVTCKKCATGGSHGPYWYRRDAPGVTMRYLGRELPAEVLAARTAHDRLLSRMAEHQQELYRQAELLGKLRANHRLTDHERAELTRLGYGAALAPLPVLKTPAAQTQGRPVAGQDEPTPTVPQPDETPLQQKKEETVTRPNPQPPASHQEPPPPKLKPMRWWVFLEDQSYKEFKSYALANQYVHDRQQRARIYQGRYKLSTEARTAHKQFLDDWHNARTKWPDVLQVINLPDPPPTAAAAKSNARLGPASCSECGRPAIEGTFLCPDHSKKL